MTDAVFDIAATAGGRPFVAPRVREATLSLLAVLAAAALLAAPALLNGFPLLYWDSADYIEMPFTGRLPVWRTVSYVLITALAKPTGTLWTAVAVQCVLIAYMLHEAIAFLTPARPWRVLIPVTLGLSALTALPWFTSQLMADGFTGVLVLGMAALAFGRDDPGAGRRAALAVALAIAVAVHTSHIALAGGLALLLLGLAAAARIGLMRWLNPRVTLPLLVVGLGVVLAVAANWSLTGRVFLSQSTSNLMLARLVQDGIAQRYLDSVCPKGMKLRLCRVKDRLPHNANFFLWFPGPFYEIGGWTRPVQEEAQFVVHETLRLYPWAHVKSAIDLTLEQLGMLHTGDGIINLDTIHATDSIETDPFFPRIIKQFYPDDLPAYMESRQRTNMDFTWINQVHVPLAYGGIAAAVAVAAIGFRRRNRLAAGVAMVAVVAILGNAFVCGALSNPNHRYQARIAWTGLVATGIGAAALRRRREDAPEALLWQRQAGWRVPAEGWV